MEKKDELSKLLKDIPVLYNEEDGFFANIPMNGGLIELSDEVSSLVQRFGIGQNLSKKHWGVRRANKISSLLKKYFVKLYDKRNGMKKPASPVSLYKDLQRGVTNPDEQFSKYDFERVARTEAANMKVISQLMLWKKAGVVYVKSHLKNGKDHGKKDVQYNGKEFKIDYLLTHEDDRIPYHINCKCFYTASYRGIKQ